MPESDVLEGVLGQTVTAYHVGHDEVMLKFDNGKVLQWSGYHAKPLDADKEDLRDIWEERAEWVEEDE